MRTNHGFTLAELLITIAIVGILASQAVPSYQRISASSGATAFGADLITGLSRARSEALRLNRPVIICARTDDPVNAECNVEASWENGWIIFVEEMTSANNQYDETADEIVRTEYLGGSGLSTQAVNKKEVALPRMLRFHSNGRWFGINSGANLGRLSRLLVCHDRVSGVGVNLVLNPSGRISKRDLGADCG